MNPVADGVEGLSAAWLSHALALDVRSVSAERIGNGQTGITYRLTLDTAGVPSTIVAKLAAGDDAARARVSRGYRNEVGFYADLAGSLDVRTPRCLYAAITDDGTRFTLLLDDLAPLVQHAQVDGCSVALAEDAVLNLAGLHAPRWCDDSLFDLAFLSRPSESVAEFLGAMAQTATEEFVSRYRGDLDAADVATLQACAAAATAWQLARPEPFAVVHGDYRLDNLLFPAEGAGVVAVDWQTVTVGPPTRDLSYFLGTSLTLEDRRVAESHLVAGYHAALVERDVEGYDGDRCFENYRLGQLQGPFITTVGCAFATAGRSVHADAMFLAMARRCCAAVRDLGSLDLL